MGTIPVSEDEVIARSAQQAVMRCVGCPTCGALPGELCATRDERGRYGASVAHHWIHDARMLRIQIGLERVRSMPG